MQKDFDLIEFCRKTAGDAVLGAHAVAGDATVLLAREALIGLMTALRDDPKTAFDVLIDVTAVDYAEFPPEARGACSPVDRGHPADLPRFEVVYHLLSMAKKHRLRVKVPLNEDDLHVPTLFGLWLAANWGEREAYDMYGIQFDGHPDLRRILTYEEFEGHPLRKDYPLRGYQPLTALPTLHEYAEQETYR